MIDGQQQSGAGYGDGGQSDAGMSNNAGADAPEQGGGMDSSGGAGGTGVDQEQQQGDQAVQRSETIEAEDIEFEADDDLIDDEDE